MPNWKKIIVSGSDAVLNSVTTTNGAIITGSLRVTGSSNLLGNQTITGSLLLTQSYISKVDYVDYTVSPGTLAHSEGRTYWDVDRKTLQIDTDVNDFTISAGHVSVLRGRNTNSYTLTKGTVVYINGNSGQFATFTSASWENDPNSAYTIGLIAQDINANQFGYAVTDGEITGVDTNGFAPATLLYLSSSGQYTGTKPVAPKHTVRLGQVVVASVNGILQVKIDNGYELGELHDVADSTTTSSYGDLLVKSGSLWINSKQLTGSYGLTGSLTATSFTGSLFGTASWAVSASRAIAADNGGVTSIIAGTGISVNQSTGAVTITNTTAYPPGGVTYDIQYNNGGVFGGNSFFQYDAVNNKVKFENNNDAVTTPLTNANYNTIETYNSNNGLIPINAVDYQFTTAQFPYAKKILANALDASIIKIEANASGSDPGLLVHSFKCDYTLVGISGDDKRIIHTRCGTLYCSWDDNSGTYPRPTITDTYNNSIGAEAIKLDTDAIFEAVYYNGVGTNSGIELRLDNGTATKDLVFNGLFTIFSMK